LLDRVEEDAWTRNHALARERPLYRVQADDAEGRLLYVSSHSGLVVRDATAHERAWNLLGAWLHWLYPLREVMPKALWSVALVYGALLAAVLVLLGMLIGLMRWRFAGRYRNGSHSPYPVGAGRVHHVGGLLSAWCCWSGWSAACCRWSPGGCSRSARPSMPPRCGKRR